MVNDEAQPYADWVGRTETVEELIGAGPALAAAATLDDTGSAFTDGAALPPLWHWFYFLPKAPQSAIGPDGHPRRGGFLPPIPLPRRMFAGARLTFPEPLRIGRDAQRHAEIRAVSQKSGRSGLLAFVTVGYTIRQDGRTCVEEEQDIVYRQPGAPVGAPVAAPLPPPPEHSWWRMIAPDPVLLFRFSALTFNAHRIHYDRPYAMAEEGYPGLVVHGPLTALLLIELLRAHAKRPVASFSFRGQAPLFDLSPFRIMAVANGDAVTLAAHGPDGGVAMSAEVRFG